MAVCLSACLSVCLSACLCVCLSACLSVCLPVCVSVCLSLLCDRCEDVREVEAVVRAFCALDQALAAALVGHYFTVSIYPLSCALLFATYTTDWPC